MSSHTYEFASFRVVLATGVACVLHVKGCDDSTQSISPEFMAGIGRLITNVADALDDIRTRHQADTTTTTTTTTA